MGDVDVGHKKIVMADAGNSAAAFGTSVDGAILPNDVVVTNLQNGRLTLVPQVLWRVAN